MISDYLKIDFINYLVYKGDQLTYKRPTDQIHPLLDQHPSIPPIDTQTFHENQRFLMVFLLLFVCFLYQICLSVFFFAREKMFIVKLFLKLLKF